MGKGAPDKRRGRHSESCKFSAEAPGTVRVRAILAGAGCSCSVGYLAAALVLTCKMSVAPLHPVETIRTVPCNVKCPQGTNASHLRTTRLGYRAYPKAALERTRTA